MTLGEQLSLCIKRSKTTRKAVAKEAGVSEFTLRSVLNDKEDVKLGTYKKVAAALGKKICYSVE